MDLSGSLLLLLAAIMIAIRLPSFFRRQNMSKVDRLVFVILAFGLLGLAWLVSRMLGMLI